MAIAEDASTPAVAVSPDATANTSLSSAAFSPPDNCMLVAMVVVNYAASRSTFPTISIEDSRYGTWKPGPVISSKASCAKIAFFTRQITTSPGSMYVTTYRGTDTAKAKLMLAVRVLTGASPDQALHATKTASGTGGTSISGTVTTSQVGSWVYVMSDYHGTNAATAISGTTTIQSTTDTADAGKLNVGRQTSATTTPGPTNLGWTTTSIPAGYGWIFAALEIVPYYPDAATSNLPDWQYPETWAVGDHLDAATLNRRIRDQNRILLRRPLLVAHMTASQTAVHNTDTSLSWDTIDQDDDGMCLSGTPATTFYCQRDGTYQFWLNAEILGNGVGGFTWQTSIWINGTRRWDLQTVMTNVSGKVFCHSSTGIITMAHGETLQARTWQDTGGTCTLPAQHNTPRFAIMWLGIT